MEEDRLKWRGLRMDNELQAEIKEAGIQAKKKDKFLIKVVDNYLKAA
ncbi:hypothetical protein K8I28_05590 [bacterium]|nr:hypothetical protein [bacterium]